MIIVFLVEAAVKLINAIGATKINDLVRPVQLVSSFIRFLVLTAFFFLLQLWTLINYLPVPTSKAAAEQRKLQAEYLAARREMNATSSQDEFAKWAKLRRKHDKQLEQLEASSTYRPRTSLTGNLRHMFLFPTALLRHLRDDHGHDED